MTHKQSLNPHANANHPVPTSDEKLQPHLAEAHQKPNLADNVPTVMNSLGAGKKLKNERLQALYGRIISSDSVDDLAVITEKLFQKLKKCSSRGRLFNFVISGKLTAFGVAPAWRTFSLPENTDSAEADQVGQLVSDLRVIDLQWLHASRKDDDSVWACSVNNDYRELMSKETFDYVTAQKIANAQKDRILSTDELGLHEDIQRELVAYRTPDIEQEIHKIISLRVEVEKDLRIAANRNRNMGKKLIDVMQDRLDQWMSVQITKSSSNKVKYETYKKITGSKITLSSYSSKLQSLKNALIWADSKYKV